MIILFYMNGEINMEEDCVSTNISARTKLGRNGLVDEVEVYRDFGGCLPAVCVKPQEFRF